MVVSTCLLKTEGRFQTGTLGMTSNIAMKEGHSVMFFNTYEVYSRTKPVVENGNSINGQIHVW